MNEASPPPESEFILSAQIPAVPPDETPSLHGVRSLTNEEVELFRKDAALVATVAGTAGYRRAVTAYEQLFEAVHSAQAGADRRPTARAAGPLGRGLTATAHALRELPEALAHSLAEHLPGDADAGSRFAAVVDEAATQGDFRLGGRLDALDPARLVVVREDAGVEAVAMLADAAAWAAAADVDDAPNRIGVLTVVESALEVAATVVARWLLEQRKIVDSACRRIKALDGEVFQGAAFVVEWTLGDDGELLHLKHFEPLKLADVATVQYAIARAEAVADPSDRSPAVRGPRAMTAETIEAIIGLPGGGQVDEGEGEVGAEAEETADAAQARAAGADARDRPLDLNSLIGHLQLGTVRLEQAWSRALDREDVASFGGDWSSLMQALIGETEHDDESVPEEDRRFALPPALPDVVALLEDTEAGASDRRRRVAQAMTFADLAASIPALTEPSNRLSCGGVRSATWFSSGAFAIVHQQLRLVAALLDATGPEPASAPPLALAQLARLRGDPLAEVIHLARALRQLPEAQVPADGTGERAAVERVHDLAAHIAGGETIALEEAVLCALAARQLLARMVAA